MTKEQDEIKRKIAEGWYVNDKGILVPPQPSTQKKRLDVSKTSDPDYFAETLLYEIRQANNSVVECYRALEEHLTKIENRITKKRQVRKET